MNIPFHKYQGAGNDFILIDNRQNICRELNEEKVKQLCHRRFGIGADGVILLHEKPGYDFEMKYYNSDGKPASMCGNGGRCIVKFVYHLGIHKELYKFLAVDGEHQAEIDTEGIVSLKIKDVKSIRKFHNDFILDTGSPHYVKIVNHVMDLDVYKKGFEIRHSKDFQAEGINVNFVEQTDDPDTIIVRTFERGVEDETWSCGTGVTACALICFHNENGFNEVNVKTLGGNLSVEYDRVDDDHYENIWLCGPAEKAFEGSFEL
jgi:diaminopimelate epimerase